MDASVSAGAREPIWLAKARTFIGITEGAGAKDNLIILGWAKKLGGWVASFFVHDSIAWCGLFVAMVMQQAGFADLPKNPLGALNWSTWGKPLKVPALGAILTFQRPGGGHVGFYVGEDAEAYHVLGGNRCQGCGRSPRPRPDPAGGRRMAHPVTAAVPLLPLSFCAPHPQDVSVPAGIPCTVGPPPLSAGDQLTDPTARWVVTVAESGRTICGWQKPSK